MSVFRFLKVNRQFKDVTFISSWSEMKTRINLNPMINAEILDSDLNILLKQFLKIKQTNRETFQLVCSR